MCVLNFIYLLSDIKLNLFVIDVEKQENYCVHFNKTCVRGPHLDPEKVAKIPDKTASARPPAAVKLALEMIIEIAKDKVEAMDVIQEGFGAKLFSKGKSKVLKKVNIYIDFAPKVLLSYETFICFWHK